ncbi:transposase [Natronococcus jeotgali]
MSSSTSAYEPDCPECGWILPESWRLEDDRSRWECRNCRHTFGVHEVIQ